MSRRRKKRKGMGTVIFLALVIVVCAAVLNGLVRGENLTANLKSAVNEKVTEQVMEQAIRQVLENSGYPEASAKAKEIVGSMDEAAKKEVAEIVQKYVDKDTLSDLVDMVGDGVTGDSVKQVKEYLQENVSAEDIQKLQKLYEKYAEKVP